jgi:hypothetical protein
MGREVITEADVEEAKLRKAAAGGLAAGAERISTADDYKDRLMKYIPAEVVSLYLFLVGLLRTVNEQGLRAYLEWGVFIVMLLMTPFFLHLVQKVKKKQQLGISTVSFAVWAFALGGPFTQLPYPWYHPIYGALLLPIFTFTIPMWEAKK